MLTADASSPPRPAAARHRGRTLAVAGLAWLATAAIAQPPAAGPARSPRNASYSIDVRLDAEAKLLDGRQTLTWTNRRDSATAELWFHLYWNAWSNRRSTWMLEDRFRGRSDRGDEIRDGDWSYLRVDSITGQGVDLTGAARFAAPDDGNPDDRTVLVVDLPQPVEPGESVEIEMEWQAKIPRTFARTGFRGDFFFIAHWFPKLGVYEEEGWSCHQFHAATEFYSDFGNYDVRITLPAELVVGATGRRVERRDNGDGTLTLWHVQEDVHGFTWTASPDFVERRQRFEAAGLPPIDMRLLIQPEHLGQAERHFAAATAAFEHYGSWFGAYPYGHVTIVDPAYGSGAGGMEYPTLFTAGTRLFNPPGGGSPEGVTIHEAGHQFWYGLVGNDEFEHAWLDEGINTFSTERTLSLAFGPETFVKRYFAPPGTDESGFLPVLFDDIEESWEVPATRLNRYREDASSDVPARATYLYHPESASNISYSKTALWLLTLERHLGWDTLRQILAVYFERFKFAHPRPVDFVAVAEEVAGRDLSWFFDQVLYGDRVFDYAIDSVASVRLARDGYAEPGGPLAPGAGDEEAAGDYRTEVVVKRLGDGVFPVEVLMVFEDGGEVRRRWDGAYRWKLFVEERPAKLASAAVDPERVLILDVDQTNNSRRLEGSGELAAVKWASRWMIWFQDLLTAFGFFA